MSETTVVVTLKKGSNRARVEGTRVAFSPHQCLAFDDGEDDRQSLRVLGAHLMSLSGLALFGTGHFLDYLLKYVPELTSYVLCIIPDRGGTRQARTHGIPVATCGDLPAGVNTVFLCETLTASRMEMRRQLPSHVNVVEPTILGEIIPDAVPARSWTPVPRNIYPIDIPAIAFKKQLDLILIDCPSRNLALMPNGLAYVNNALKKTSVTYQIFDLDIVAYHRFHLHRLFDMGGRIVLSSGRVLPEDPWQAEHYDVWTAGSETEYGRGGHSDVLEFFRPIIDETINALVEAKPKILGLSIQQCNEAISREIARGVKAKLPDIVIIVGGFSCYNADAGRRVFPDCDYMCVGEADLTVGPLVEDLARGARPANLPGVLSRYDTPRARFIPAPMVHNLDHIEFPKYEWCDLSVYRNYNDYQLTPIIASRGCRWSRCTFCAERFYWRIRSPENFVDELQWLVDRGCYLFMFNESDLNGMPERVMEICDEIIRRGLHRKIKLTGQLRIHKKSNRAFFEKLRAANFVALRFGVDAFSENTLRLQKKGYTVDMISQNLKDCWEVGIFTEVNWVIGIPGETDEDIREGIDLILKNQKFIGRLANINPLILVNGGVYWIDPDAHNIRFRESKDSLYAKYPRALPADSWYSVNPYIDAQVRKDRFERIVVALHDAGFPVGAWANRIIEDVKLARDPNRAAVGKEISPPPASNPRHLAETSAPPPDDAGERGEEPRRLGQIQPSGNDGEDAATGGSREGKPAATPPLFGVAGKPPRFVRRLATHNVVFLNGWYYGIPHALSGVDLNDSEQSLLAGVIRHSSEEGVVAVIGEASRWANTRGQYDAQEDQRAHGSYLRAASALGEAPVQAIARKPRILRFKGEIVAIESEILETAFRSGRSGLPRSDERMPVIEPRTTLRRLAARLSPSMQREIKRIVRAQSIQDGGITGGLRAQSDRRLLAMLWRGIVSAGSAKLRDIAAKGGRAARAAQLQGGVDHAEADVSIVSVVTKNALPELMWSLEGYNIVKYDGVYFGLPHGTSVDWEADDVRSIPGVVAARSAGDAVNLITGAVQIGNTEETVGAARNLGTAPGASGAIAGAPVLLGALEAYNVVMYEGWIYGIPQSLGPIDLTEVDLIEVPGVIRDVSRDVVENEILDRVKDQRRVTA